MEKFEVAYKKVKSAEDAYKKASKKINDKYLAGFGISAETKFDEKKFKISAKGSGFSLALNFKDDKTSVELDLSFLLKALKGKITTTLTKELESLL